MEGRQAADARGWQPAVVRGPLFRELETEARNIFRDVRIYGLKSTYGFLADAGTQLLRQSAFETRFTGRRMAVKGRVKTERSDFLHY